MFKVREAGELSARIILTSSRERNASSERLCATFGSCCSSLSPARLQHLPEPGRLPARCPRLQRSRAQPRASLAAPSPLLPLPAPWCPLELSQSQIPSPVPVASTSLPTCDGFKLSSAALRCCYCLGFFSPNWKLLQSEMLNQKLNLWKKWSKEIPCCFSFLCW